MSSGRESSSSSSTGFVKYPYVKFGKLLCACGDGVVLRRARTSSNNGQLFWGCSNFKGVTNFGCDYFEWFDDGESVRQESMQWKLEIQLKEIEELKKELTEAQKNVENLRQEKLGLEDGLIKTQRWKSFWKGLCYTLSVVLMVIMLCS